MNPTPTNLPKEVREAVEAALEPLPFSGESPLPPAVKESMLARTLAAIATFWTAPAPKDSGPDLDEILRQETHLNSAGRANLAKRILKHLNAAPGGEERIGGFRITPEGFKMNAPKGTFMFQPDGTPSSFAYPDHLAREKITEQYGPDSEIARTFPQWNNATLSVKGGMLQWVAATGGSV